jgi:hypothetical protein
MDMSYLKDITFEHYLGERYRFYYLVVVYLVAFSAFYMFAPSDISIVVSATTTFILFVISGIKVKQSTSKVAWIINIFIFLFVIVFVSFILLRILSNIPNIKYVFAGLVVLSILIGLIYNVFLLYKNSPKFNLKLILFFTYFVFILIVYTYGIGFDQFKKSFNTLVNIQENILSKISTSVTTLSFGLLLLSNLNHKINSVEEKRQKPINDRIDYEISK